MRGILRWWMWGWLAALPAEGRGWTDEVMYFVLTDRFHDGDVTNNVPEGSDPRLYDRTQGDLDRYHGGDLRGLELAIRAGYFRQLGVTTLWITPPVKNAWRSGYDTGGWKTGYHGYWAQDFLDIDPHLTSPVSLEGHAYPVGPEGRMRHYRDFVRLAHAHGLKVVQDVVLNHAGPVFYYDADGDGRFDRQAAAEWVRPFRRDGYHEGARWMDVREWNLMRTRPEGPRTVLGREVRTTGVLAQLTTYGRKGFSWDSLGKADGEEMECDFFSLRDFWTHPGSEHFDRLVDEFVEIYAFYLLDVGVDGLRVDTVKHVHHEFWDAFTERLRKRLGPAAGEKLIFGEVYDGDPAKLGQYTWRADAPARTEPCLDSVLNFSFCFAVREYLRKPGGEHGHPAAVERAMKDLAEGERGGRRYYNPQPGPDGLNAVEKSVMFVENHDGLNRFRVRGVTLERHRLTQALMLTMPGIPCVYYGAEFGMEDRAAGIGEEAESGRMTLFPRVKKPLVGQVMDETFRGMARAIGLRKKMKVLREGRFTPVWMDSGESAEDDGVMVFAREDGEERVLVALNASGQAKEFAVKQSVMAEGVRLRGEVVTGDGEVPGTVVGAGGEVRLRVPEEGLVLYIKETK